MKITCSKKVPVMADAAEEMRAKYRQRRADAHAKKVSSDLKQILESDDQLEAAFELFVPSSGPASSLGGELVRAMMKVMYRDLNDGDIFYEGYGIETCGDAIYFLWDTGPNSVSKLIEKIAENEYRDDRYTEALNEMSEALMEELTSNFEEYFKSEPGEYDYLSVDGESFIREQGWEPLYDTDVMIPEELAQHIEVGNISERDLEWEIESWDGVRDAVISIESDYIYFSEMPKEAYDEISDHMYDWLESYARDLTEEYGDPFEEEEEEEYDEEEYDEEEE